VRRNEGIELGLEASIQVRMWEAERASLTAFD